MFITRAIVAALSIAGATGAASAEEATLCGKKADMVQIVLEMQAATVEKVWTDNKLFVNRDTTTGTLWVFSMPKTTVHPAAACREASAGKDAVGLLCTAAEKVCASFRQQAIERMDKIVAGAR